MRFALSYVSSPRDVAVIKAAAEKAGCETLPSPNPKRGNGDILTGRGISYTLRAETIVATVAEIEVNRKTGRIWAKKFTVAHDCGLIINPQGLRYTIEGNVVQGLSRTLFEEVRFDRDSVISVDWTTYPVLELVDAPESIEIVLTNQPNVAPSGAGEPSIRSIPGAIANAFSTRLAFGFAVPHLHQNASWRHWRMPELPNPLRLRRIHGLFEARKHVPTCTLDSPTGKETRAASRAFRSMTFREFARSSHSHEQCKSLFFPAINDLDKCFEFALRWHEHCSKRRPTAPQCTVSYRHDGRGRNP